MTSDGSQIDPASALGARMRASAKFAGSGGAIVGTYDSEPMFEQVRDRLAAFGSRTVKPRVIA